MPFDQTRGDDGFHEPSCVVEFVYVSLNPDEGEAKKYFTELQNALKLESQKKVKTFDGAIVAEQEEDTRLWYFETTIALRRDFNESSIDVIKRVCRKLNLAFYCASQQKNGSFLAIFHDGAIDTLRNDSCVCG